MPKKIKLELKDLNVKSFTTKNVINNIVGGVSGNYWACESWNDRCTRDCEVSVDC